jgi:hypothetical protein
MRQHSKARISDKLTNEVISCVSDIMGHYGKFKKSDVKYYNKLSDDNYSAVRHCYSDWQRSGISNSSYTRFKISIHRSYFGKDMVQYVAEHKESRGSQLYTKWCKNFELAIHSDDIISKFKEHFGMNIDLVTLMEIK